MKHDERMPPSVFVEFFGNYPFIRVLDFLLENEGYDYNKKEICRQADISWNTLEKFWNQLEETKIMVHTRKIGKADMYKINTQNILVKQLLELNLKLMKLSMDKIVPSKKTVSVAADSD